MSTELFAVGISWRTAPVAVRERLAVPEDELAAVLEALRRGPAVAEAMLVSTCNRVEIYGAAEGGAGDAAVAAVRRILPETRGVAPHEVAPVLFGHARGDAVRHVFRVAAALDSLVIGEAQILGQLKAAYQSATAVGATGPILRRCLERAFGVAKRVRAETAIARGAANVSSVAVELAGRVFGDLRGKHVLVVGAGKMSALAARHLRRAGVETLVHMEAALFGGAGDGVLGRYYIRLCCDFFQSSSFIVEAGGQPAGYLLSFIQGKEVYCTTLAVLPRYQGTRATHALVRAFVSSIIDHAEVCWFTVEEDNHAARALHAMLGAKEVEVRPDFYGPGHPRIVSRIDRDAFLALRSRFDRLGVRDRSATPANAARMSVDAKLAVVA